MTRRGYWRNPQTGSLDRICVIGVPPESGVLDLEPVRQNRQALGEPDTVLADELSRSSGFGHFVPGEVSELSGHRVRVVGTFKLGINAQSNGNLITSDRNLLKLFPEYAGATVGENAVTIGVLRIRPGADPDQVRDQPCRRPCPLTFAFSRAISSSPRNAISGTMWRPSAPSFTSAW